VDALGSPLRFVLTGGERHDKTQALSLVEGFQFGTLIADKGYDYDDLLGAIASGNRRICVPSSVNRRVQRVTDWHLYRERHLVECFINKLKHFRRVFSRFDKLAKNYLSFVQFASTLIWLR
jgi:transposase